MESETYLEDVDEFGVGDVTVLVLIEVVEDDAQLLPREEDTKLGHEFFELKLLQHTILVAVKALHTNQTAVSNRASVEGAESEVKGTEVRLSEHLKQFQNDSSVRARI